MSPPRDFVERDDAGLLAARDVEDAAAAATVPVPVLLVVPVDLALVALVFINYVQSRSIFSFP